MVYVADVVDNSEWLGLEINGKVPWGYVYGIEGTDYWGVVVYC